MGIDGQSERVTEPASLAPAHDILPRGTSLGRYVLLDVVGQGAMGVVYSAYDEKLGRRLAIKLLRVERVESRELVSARLLREAQAMARLTHPNVVSIFDVGTFEDRVFLVMEFVEGETLTQWIQTKRPWRESLAILLGAGRGLAAAHEAGIIHRDFKPDNVLIGAAGRVLVTDFGLARDADSAPTEPETTSSPPPESPPPLSMQPAFASNDPSLATPWIAARTAAADVLGAIGFMAPEQAHGKPTTIATDQFSYCVTVYLALYGRLPFPASSLASYVRALHKMKPEAPPSTDVPQWVRSILLKGMSRRPEDRYASMNELLDALASDPRKHVRRVSLLALGLAASIATAAVGLRAASVQSASCGPNANEWAGVWDAPSRAEAAHAFAVADPLHGPEAFEHAAKGLDGYLEKWRLMSLESCQAMKMRGAQSEEVLRLRTECLERRKLEVASVSRLLRNADRDVVRQGVSLAYSLESIAGCGDVDALRGSAGLPDDPAKRASVRSVLASLADVKSLLAAGKLKEGSAMAAGVVGRARPIDHGPTLAEALYAEGDARQRQGGFAESVAPLHEAFLVAFGAGADAVMIESASKLAFVLGAKLQQLDQAKQWNDTARAGLARVGGAPALELDVLDGESSYFAEGEWRPDLATPLDEKILVETRELYGEHPATERAVYGLAVDLVYLGEPARALPLAEEAAKLAEGLGGGQSAEAGRGRYLLGRCRTLTGDFDAGETLLRHAIAVFDENEMSYWSSLAFEALTWSAMAQGDRAGAASAAEHALELLAKAKSPTVLVPIVDTQAGIAFARNGRAGEALALCERALALQEKANSLSEEKAYGWDALRCKGEALIALGRGDEAVAYLERSLTLHHRMAPGDYARAEFALARALASVHRDVARAVVLAKSAGLEFSRSPSLLFERKEVESWLSSARK